MMTQNLQEFRIEVRQWLEKNCPQSMRIPAANETEMVWSGKNVKFLNQDQQLWFERMRDKGWFTPAWPSDYQGGGLSDKQARILEQEISAINARPAQINLGVWMLGPVLLEFGTEAQKQEHLPPMARGEIRWCQGFSEPNAGSDLASLQMKAIDDGDDFIVTGSKIWTSYADESDAIYALVRTDFDAAKHTGISFLMIDMTLPGITVKPIELISGKSHFSEVFFDEVRVPKANMVGELNKGWNVAKRLMQHERVAIGKLQGEGQCNYRLSTMAKKHHEINQYGQLSDVVLRDQIANFDMDEHAFGLTMQRVMEEAKAGIDSSAVSSIFKLYGTELEKRKTEGLLSILGSQGLGWHSEGFTDDEQSITRSWLMSKAMSIGGGTSEIQLNVIAKRVLGLPTE